MGTPGKICSDVFEVYACSTGSADAVTIVDSDQLLARGCVDPFSSADVSHTGPYLYTRAESTDLALFALAIASRFWIALLIVLVSRVFEALPLALRPGDHPPLGGGASAPTLTSSSSSRADRIWGLEEVPAILAAVRHGVVPRDDRYLQFRPTTLQDVDDASRPATF